MEQSMTLISAQIHFIPILQLLLPTATENETQKPLRPSSSHAGVPWTAQHPFINISVTPIECSVACSRSLAHELFVPVIESLDKAAQDEVSLATDQYVVIQVDGEGLEAGQRVLELTSPLAMAGISIFFITTYFSDYILVPAKSKGQVVTALEKRGFAFEKQADAFVNQSRHHHRNASSSSSFEVRPPSSPPPTSISELQIRTFALLERRHIKPQVDSTIRLIQCAGRKNPSPSGSSINEAELHLGIVKCLVNNPRFLSLTLTDTEPASLLLEKRLIPQFGSHEVLLGSKEDILIPITLDLRDLPLESTGIVCGVAGSLVGGTTGGMQEAVEMSYLSTARAGTVMVSESELERALEALRVGENGIKT
ncbi:MAG: hypothetical protein M1835_001714 [Candelina submexicana]|nr:MAG: hypothetical protein M1835_001714 [Candelina submexicana]